MRLKGFKKRYLLYIVFIGYVLLNNSCLTMRSSHKETHAFFEEHQIIPTDSTLQIDKRKIHYLQTGVTDAPTLVFIHGSPGSWNAYKNYLIDSELSKKYRIIAIDRPGFGHSNFRKSMGLAEQSKLLNKVLKKLANHKSYTLIGHSYGGPLIAKMGIDEPELYQNLIILAGALDPEAEKPENWRYPFYYFPLKYIVPGALKPSNDELVLLKKDLFPLKSELNTLSQNVLIIHGTEDKLVPYSNVAYMEKHFVATKKLQVISLEKENHFIVWSKEAFLKKTIQKWVDSIQ